MFVFTRNRKRFGGLGAILQVFVLVLLSLGMMSSLSAKDYCGGELRTFESYTYGRFEVKMRSARGSGMLSSFFTYHDGGLGWNELDVEIMGSKVNEVQFNAITPGQVNHVYTKKTNFFPYTGYHVYAFEWTPSYVAWFIDGEEVHRQTGSHIQQLVHPQKIMMNIWQPESVGWAGEFDPAILPVFAYYDWVKYYAYNENSGDYGSDNNFSHRWTDDFTFWDQSRWAKATHTFGGNNADFMYENIAFYNGNMILCLTEPDDLGFDPAFPPFDQKLDLYNGFEITDPFEWYRWNGLDGQRLQPVDNPDVGDGNPSGHVLETVRLNNYTAFYAPLSEGLDLSENHTFSMLVLTRVPDTKVIFKLQNNKLAGPTSNEVTSSRVVVTPNVWTKLYFDFSPAVNRQDLNQIAIQFSDGDTKIDTCYIDDIYGPPVLTTNINEDISVPEDFELKNYPNPFNATTTFSFKLPESTQVEFDIYDIKGNLIDEMISGFLERGEHHYSWPAEDLVSGVYLGRLRYKNNIVQRKFLLLR